MKRQFGKVLFIIHDVYQDHNMFPVGIGYLASVLRDAGHEVEVYCMDVFHYTNDELAKKLDKNEYDLIGIGFLAARFKETVEELIKITVEHKKSAWVELGGHGPSPIPEYMLETTGADIICIGESEETILELINAKLNGDTLADIRGIAYRKDGEIVINPLRKPVRNLDELPFPAWDLFPLDKYINSVKPAAMEEGDRTFEILTSRGCVNRCSFCYRMDKGVRLRSIQNVFEEIKHLYDTYEINYFIMMDELFVISKNRIIELINLLKKHNMKIKYSANCRVDIFDDEMAELLKESGCVFLNIGFESTSQNVLNLMNKNVTTELNVKAAEIALKHDIGMGLNFIWGMPGDDKDTIRENASFIKKFNMYDQIRTIRPVTPYPGCDLYYDAIKSGKLSGAADFFEKFRNSDLLTVNFMKMSDAEAYDVLLEVNTDLINDHFEHTSKDFDVAEQMINNLRELYYGDYKQFRGVRHYTDKDKNNIGHLKKYE